MFDEVLDALHRFGSRFVVIGSMARALTGDQVAPADLDMMIDASTDGRRRLCRALADLGATVETRDGWRRIEWCAVLPWEWGFRVSTAAGQVDLITQLIDGTTIDDHDAHATTVQLCFRLLRAGPPDATPGRSMSAATGLGLLDLMILEAIEAAGARHDRPYLKTQRALDVLHERTGIGPSQAYESLCDMARPYVAHLRLVDFHGNYGSPDFGPAAARYTECRLTELGEAALAAERGELGSLPIALINGDLHQGRRRPPLDPRRVREAIRAAANVASDDSIIQMIGLPSFPSRCDVSGDLAAFASGAPSEIVASAVMVDGLERGRPTVTITAMPPFTSASRIGELVQNAVMHHGRGRPGRLPSDDDDAPCPVSDVTDGSAGGQTQLVVVGRAEASHADVRRFLDRIRTVHQRVQIELGRPITNLVRNLATSEDLSRRLDLIEQSIGP